MPRTPSARHAVPRRLDRESLAAGVRAMVAIEPRFAPQVRRLGPPPLWERDPGFETLVRIVLEQQVALASADALRRRLQERLGGIDPERIAAAGEDGLRALGMTRQKASYCVGIAREVLDGRLDFGALDAADDDAAHAMLLGLRGIGPWSAAVYQLMALGRPDVFPAGDLALQLALATLHGLPRKPDARGAEALTAHWRPWRAVGARLLWQAYLNRDTLQEGAP